MIRSARPVWKRAACTSTLPSATTRCSRLPQACAFSSDVVGSADSGGRSSPTPPLPSRTTSNAAVRTSPSTKSLLGNLIPNARDSALRRSDFPQNIRTALTIKQLMAANLHLGHARAVWNKNMLPYIYGERQGIHIINLEHTLVMLRRAINVTREVAMNGGNILFVGTRPAIHAITVAAAQRADAYFVTAWVGGTITNKERVLRRSVGYDPDKVAQTMMVSDGGKAEIDAELEERAAKARSSQPYVHTPDLIIILDLPNNGFAVREANQANIPIIALCDTDCNPRRVQYPIPANDDALTGVELIAGALALASREGRTMRDKLQQEEYQGR